MVATLFCIIAKQGKSNNRFQGQWISIDFTTMMRTLWLNVQTAITHDIRFVYNDYSHCCIFISNIRFVSFDVWFFRQIKFLFGRIFLKLIFTSCYRLQECEWTTSFLSLFLFSFICIGDKYLTEKTILFIRIREIYEKWSRFWFHEIYS